MLTCQQDVVSERGTKTNTTYKANARIPDKYSIAYKTSYRLYYIAIEKLAIGMGEGLEKR